MSDIPHVPAPISTGEPLMMSRKADRLALAVAAVAITWTVLLLAFGF